MLMMDMLTEEIGIKIFNCFKYQSSFTFIEYISFKTNYIIIVEYLYDVNIVTVSCVVLLTYTPIEMRTSVVRSGRIRWIQPSSKDR
jgi:hypothetical protein